MVRDREISAGGVVYRTLRGRRMIALCRRWRTVWCLPKGKIERGETVREAALRETREETGLEAEILRSLGAIRYRYRRGERDIAKRVTFYLMRRVSGNIRDHDDEVEEVRWFGVKDVLKRAEFPSERSILKKAIRLIPRRGGGRTRSSRPSR
jgi:8-oxo-dGTP pyrophosphatase MutT (NUDIX family)